MFKIASCVIDYLYTEIYNNFKNKCCAWDGTDVGTIFAVFCTALVWAHYDKGKIHLI